ncbi:hypothetical protein [Streptomyces sp. CL12-4]|uniref:hypothetical protein n=1 Tax=Streptomyces sp. CL12-4 TaxID=2810306 RepID=UPI001EFB857B|nr:hypothetical protein [Streptomyces sp. CL12-4]MCG8968905.1 hypothetical protein [Streptomyces sp. CL12-4]
MGAHAFDGATVAAGRLEVGIDLTPPGRPVDVVYVELAHEAGLADLLVRVGDPCPDEFLCLVQGQVGPVLRRVWMHRGEVQVRRLLEVDEGIALVAAEAVLRAVPLDSGAEQVVGVDLLDEGSPLVDPGTQRGPLDVLLVALALVARLVHQVPGGIVGSFLYLTPL